MAHSFCNMFIHAVWSTKEREPLIVKGIENKLYGFMTKQFLDLGCEVRIINGMPDHVHCFFSLNPQRSVADVIKQVKGSSSHFINQQNSIPFKFSWQTGYAAYSVSSSRTGKILEYIQKQKDHHINKSFEQEYNEFLQQYV